MTEVSWKVELERRHEIQDKQTATRRRNKARRDAAMRAFEKAGSPRSAGHRREIWIVWQRRQGRTLKAIGLQLGLSVERTRQLEERGQHHYILAYARRLARSFA